MKEDHAEGGAADLRLAQFAAQPPELGAAAVQLGRRLLAEAGFPGGAGFPKVTLVYNTLESHRLIAEFVQRSLKDTLGITIQLENMEWKSLLKRVAAGDFDMARQAWCSIPDPWDHFVIFTGDSANNHTAWQSDAYDALFESANATLDTPTRMARFAEAEALLLKDVPATFLYHYSNAYLKKPFLRGFSPDLTDRHLVRYMYWAGDTPPALP